MSSILLKLFTLNPYISHIYMTQDNNISELPYVYSLHIYLYIYMYIHTYICQMKRVCLLYHIHAFGIYSYLCIYNIFIRIDTVSTYTLGLWYLISLTCILLEFIYVYRPPPYIYTSYSYTYSTYSIFHIQGVSTQDTRAVRTLICISK